MGIFADLLPGGGPGRKTAEKPAAQKITQKDPIAPPPRVPRQLPISDPLGEALQLAVARDQVAAAAEQPTPEQPPARRIRAALLSVLVGPENIFPTTEVMRYTKGVDNLVATISERMTDTMGRDEARQIATQLQLAVTRYPELQQTDLNALSQTEPEIADNVAALSLLRVFAEAAKYQQIQLTNAMAQVGNLESTQQYTQVQDLLRILRANSSRLPPSQQPRLAQLVFSIAMQSGNTNFAFPKLGSI